jgi:hypothetical protein
MSPEIGVVVKDEAAGIVVETRHAAAILAPVLDQIEQRLMKFGEVGGPASQ